MLFKLYKRCTEVLTFGIKGGNPDARTSMSAGWGHTLFFLLSLLLCQALAENISEQFQEELILRPERDGKVTARFAFTTLLNGASPKDPASLGTEDECAYNVFLLNRFFH